VELGDWADKLESQTEAGRFNSAKLHFTKLKTFAALVADNRDAHGVVQRLRRADVAEAETHATHVFPDGMPMCWLARLCGAPTERLYGPAVMEAVCAMCSQSNHETPVRHVVAGGAPGVAERLADKLMKRYPGLEVVPCSLPMITKPEEIDMELVNKINALKPDILWVGLGCPKQDIWMATYRPYLNAPVMVGNGAAFNFLSGAVAQAPVWIQHSGFEWLFRSGIEPLRVGRRNIWVVPMFLAAAGFWILSHFRQILDSRNALKSEMDLSKT